MQQLEHPAPEGDLEVLVHGFTDQGCMKTPVPAIVIATGDQIGVFHGILSGGELFQFALVEFNFLIDLWQEVMPDPGPDLGRCTTWRNLKAAVSDGLPMPADLDKTAFGVVALLRPDVDHQFSGADIARSE